MHFVQQASQAADQSRGCGPSRQETESRMVIASYRDRLEWILRIPVLEPFFAEGLEILELPGPRKGIGLRAALNALLLENKYTLICWAIRNNRQRFPSKIAEKLSQDFGLELFNSLELDDHLSISQWGRFEEAFLFAIAKEHRRYKHAQTILFYIYRHLVEKIVSHAVFDAAKRSDCIQEGCMALLHAIDKVEDSDSSMNAYAQMWIRRQIKNYLMGERFAVHVPINLAAKALSQDLDKTTKETSHQAETKEASAESRSFEELATQLRQPSISLNETYEESGSVGDHIADEEAASPLAHTSHEDLRLLLGGLLRNLTEKQRQVLELRYGLNGHSGPKTLAEVSRKIGISHQQVSMREKRALQKLEDELAPYLSEIFA